MGERLVRRRSGVAAEVVCGFLVGLIEVNEVKPVSCWGLIIVSGHSYSKLLAIWGVCVLY